MSEDAGQMELLDERFVLPKVAELPDKVTTDASSLAAAPIQTKKRKSSATSQAVLSKEKLDEYRARAAKRGVVYISRVPPYMKPEKLKHLLAQYGDINRIYLVPEDKVHQKKRVSAGGNRKTKYTEGWVEFEDKKVGRRIAEMLNTKQIGGKKRDYYHDDIWNLKYLKGFKWDHLTEKIAYENRIREQKLRMEIAQSKKLNDAYLERVEQSKKFEKMDERKADKRSNNGDTNNQQHKQHKQQDRESGLDKIRRTFVQKTPASSKDQRSLTDDSDLLRKVFATSQNNKKRRTV